MKRSILSLVVVLLALSLFGMAAPLPTAARSAIPKDAQQIISIDYRSLKSSPTALALRDRVLPAKMEEFERALRALGIDPDKEVEFLVFASFRTPKDGVQVIGIAQGQFSAKSVREKLKQATAVKYGNSVIYPVGAIETSFLDDFTLLFGDSVAIRAALDSKDGKKELLDSNAEMVALIVGAETGPVWSVLDGPGTQSMMRSVLGDAASLTDYQAVKKRLLGSRYVLDFTKGVSFEVNVMTSDSMTASAFAAMLKAGVLYRRMTATTQEKAALEDITVDANGSRLTLHFRAADQDFRPLLQSDLFAAVVQ
jgi:hypothetical protein